MPFSDKYRCVFLHNPKAAGTTIEKLLEIPNNPTFLLNYSYPDPRQPALQHLPYSHLLKLIPEKMAQYFKFTFVRNPWDRVVSTYHWNSRGKFSFEEFVDMIDDLYRRSDPTEFHKLPEFSKIFGSHFYPQHFYDGVDVTVYRFEDFTNETKKLLAKFGISKPIPVLNKRDHRHYSSYYTPRTQDIIGRIYSTDIQLYGYRFEQSP